MTTVQLDTLALATLTTGVSLHHTSIDNIIQTANKLGVDGVGPVGLIAVRDNWNRRMCESHPGWPSRDDAYKAITDDALDGLIDGLLERFGERVTVTLGDSREL